MTVLVITIPGGEYSSVFELEWGKLLVDVGILFILHQFIFYLYFIISIVKSAKSRVSNNFFLTNSTITAFIIAIFSSLTNPYLSNFDGLMLILFFLGAYDYLKVNLKVALNSLETNKTNVFGYYVRLVGNRPLER